MDDETKDEYATLAHSLVDSAISKALSLLQNECNEEELAKYTARVRRPTLQTEETGEHGKAHVTVAPSRGNVAWSTIEEFTVDAGKREIMEFIKSWYYEDAWLYCIDLIDVDELEFDTRFRYRVRWSIPTRRHPIPRATASVYFTIEVSKILPKTFPINVYYVVEGNRLVHRPGDVRFEEKWLKDVIETKIHLLKNIDF